MGNSHVATYLYFDVFLQNATTVITIATMQMVPTTRTATHATTADTVTSVGGPGGGAMDAAVGKQWLHGVKEATGKCSASKDSITTGQVAAVQNPRPLPCELLIDRDTTYSYYPEFAPGFHHSVDEGQHCNWM